MQGGIDEHVGARQTVAFVQSVVASGARVLDVGCGSGVVARQLMDAGFDVTAIDRNDDAVQEAIALGVAAQSIDILQYESPAPFDAVLFARSLHHINPLQQAIESAHRLLKPDGILLLDDFGAELVDENSAVWFYGLKALLGVERDLHARGPKLEDGRIPDDPLASWREHHFGKHDVHESGAMLTALAMRFEVVEQSWGPYFYRYFVEDVSVREAQQIFAWESRSCKVGAIRPIGLRVVARTL